MIHLHKHAWVSDGNITCLTMNILREFILCFPACLMMYVQLFTQYVNMKSRQTDVCFVGGQFLFSLTCYINWGCVVILHQNNQNILILQPSMVEISLCCISMQYRTYLCDYFWHKNSNSITCLQYMKINIQIIDINLMIG